MKNKKVLIAAEVKEEVLDIFNFVMSKDINIAIFLGGNIDIETSSMNVNIKVYKERKISKIKFVQKIYSLLYFIWVSIVFKPDFIFSGFSMLKYRLISKIFSIYHIAYFRGVLFDSSNRSGICDKLYYSKLGKIKFFNKILCTYYANLVIVTSDVSKKFILERDSEITVVNAKPNWLNKFNKINFHPDKISNFVFLTQAFDSHGFPEQHKSQIKALRSIDNYCYVNDYRLIVRIHPRDLFDYKSLNLLSKLEFDSSPPDSFLAMSDVLSESVVISPLSTLAFEIIYLDGFVDFYTSESLDDIYKKSYNKLGIKPFFISDDFLEYEINRVNCSSIFSKEDFELLSRFENLFGKKI